MRLILKDYIETFKEESEMESLIENILIMKDFSNIIRPQKGIGQLGVDFSAEKDGMVYLFILKQRDIDRTNWNSGNNAVRPTLDEILDGYIPQRLNNSGKKVNIILCTNGKIKQNVEPQWKGYISRNTTSDIQYYFWGIDELVKLTEEFLLNEYIFENELKSDLRKTLYFFEEDANLRYYKELLDKLINKIKLQKYNTKSYKKTLIVYVLITKMCIYYAMQKNRKISVDMSEKALISYWNFIAEKSLYECELETEFLIILSLEYKNCCKKYISEIKKVYKYNPSFPIYNSLEYRHLIYETVGIICTYTYYLYFYHGKTNEVEENIATLITLINNNTSFYYPIYDLNSIEINILIFLLIETNNN